MQVDKINNNQSFFSEVSKGSYSFKQADKKSCKMILMITEHTTPKEFDAEWEKHPEFLLEMIGDEKTCYQRTSLHMAVKKKNLDLTIHLIKKLNNKSVDILCGNHLTPFELAIKTRISYQHKIDDSPKLFEIIHQLIINGADINRNYLSHQNNGCLLKHLGWIAGDESTYNFNESALNSALKARDIKLIKLLIHFDAQMQTDYEPTEKGLLSLIITDEQKELYNKIKREIEEVRNLFIFGFKNEKSPISKLPKELICHILTCSRVKSSIPIRVNEVKKILTESQK